MRPLLLCLLVIMLNVPAVFADDDFPASKKEKDAYAGALTGRVTKISKRTKGFTLRVEYLDLQPNTGYGSGPGGSGEIQKLARQQQDFAKLQADLLKTEKQTQRLAKLQHFSSKLNHVSMKTHAQHLPYRVVVRHESIDLQPASDIEVRIADPPPKLDESGKLHKYSADELRDLKGTGKVWGFPADWSQVEKGQLITVFLAKKKSADTDAKERPIQVTGSSNEGRPTVAKIYILTDDKKK